MNQLLFRTPIPIEKKGSLTPQKPLLLLGSCFASNIGACLRRGMWNAAVNPCGTLFNPESISMIIKRALAMPEISSSELENHEGLYFSTLFSTKFSGSDPIQSAATMTSALSVLSQYIISSQALIATFGTAWVYRLAESGITVANCHKLPASLFQRIRLTAEEIAAEWIALIPKLRQCNPNLRIIFTVSPVRHIKDTMHGNTLSKAILHLAIEKIIETCPYTEYFPAFELLNDDLRDYRFYASDMTHPSDFAINYIWQHFSDTYFDEITKAILNKAESITAALLHRYQSPDSPASLNHIKATHSQLQDFITSYPYLVPPTTD